MNVLITGAGGNLGRAVVPALVAAGHTPLLMDFRPLDSPHEVIVGDVRNAADVERAVERADAVIHAAALHGIHLRNWTPQDYWAINVSGTFNVFEAARAAGLDRIVLCSTMGVYGASARPPADAWAEVNEELPLQPTDIYGISKRLCEELARDYARRWGITTVALRLGMFVPETFERYGFRLIFGGVDDRDVGTAVLRALDYTPPDGFAAYNIMADTPFASDDLRALAADPAAVLERYYPGVRELAARRGLDMEQLIWGRTVWRVEQAKRDLGYQPAYNFDGFLRALAADDRDYYPVAELPWWGV